MDTESELLLANETGRSLLLSSQIKQAEPGKPAPFNTLAASRHFLLNSSHDSGRHCCDICCELRNVHDTGHSTEKTTGWGLDFFEGVGNGKRRRKSCFAIDLSLHCYDYRLMMYTGYL